MTLLIEVRYFLYYIYLILDSNQNIKTDDFDKTKDETLNAKPTFSFIGMHINIFY